MYKDITKQSNKDISAFQSCTITLMNHDIVAEEWSKEKV